VADRRYQSFWVRKRERKESKKKKQSQSEEDFNSAADIARIDDLIARMQGTIVIHITFDTLAWETPHNFLYPFL
jgi:hypothetical protein